MIIHPGDRHLITTDSFSGDGIVLKIHGVNSADQQGVLVEYDIDGYGQANEFFVSDDGMNQCRIEERKGRSSMPEEYVYKSAVDFNWSLYNEDVSIQKKISNAFVLNFKKFQREGRGLYIMSGTRGSGKTMLSCCLANEVLKKHDLSVKFISVPDYIELVKKKSENAKDQIEALLDAGLLIFDDVGAQVENQEWISTALYRLIDRRYTNHLPTIFTSNVGIDDLKTDSRISERIYAVSVPLVIPEVNIRRKMADKHTQDFLKNVV